MATNQNDANLTNAPVKNKKRFGVGKILLTLIALALVGGGVALWLLRSDPAFVIAQVKFLEGKTPQQIEQIVESVESRFLALLNEPAAASSSSGLSRFIGANDGTMTDQQRLYGRRVFRVSMNEANTWLSMRMPKWMADRGSAIPPFMNGFVASIDGDYLIVSFQLKTTQLTQRVSATVDLKFDDRGNATTKLISMRGGKLPLPLKTLTGAIKAGGTESIKKQVDRAMAFLDGKSFSVRQKIDSNRKLIILDLQLTDDGQLEITMDIVPRKKLSAMKK